MKSGAFLETIAKTAEKMLGFDIQGRSILLDCYINAVSGSMRLSDGTMSIGGSTELTGRDRFGKYRSVLVDVLSGEKTAIVYELRHYHDSAVVCGLAHYMFDAPLLPSDGLGITILDFPGFVRGIGSGMYADTGWPHLWATPFFTDDFGAIPSLSRFYMWEADGGIFAALAPLCGGGMRGILRPSGGSGSGISVSMSNHSDGYAPSTVALFSLALSGNPYKATELAHRAGFAVMAEKARHRDEKSYPECFNYIGWCSWNAYYREVDQDKLLATARSFRDNGFPIGWLLIDDGWHDASDGRLNSFGADPQKFPSGIKGLASSLKSEFGVKWLGVWHTLLGYWNGVDPRGEDFCQGPEMLAAMPHGAQVRISESLAKMPLGLTMPSPYGDEAYRFFSSYHKRLREEGVGFVKVDNQSSLKWQVGGELPVQTAVHAIQQALQRSVVESFNNGIINCMSQSVDTTHEWHLSNVARVSNDYQPDKPMESKTHISDCVYNALHWSQFCWPDYDMFESHHADAVAHAVSRALSGGPVYFTDTPGRENWDILRKLVFSDGRLAKPDCPALPTLDCLFVDPREEPVALKAWNTAGGIGVIGCFNVYRGSGPRFVTTTISPSDIDDLRGDSFALYDHFNDTLTIMNGRDSFPVAVEDRGVKLYIVSPLVNGFAPIGLADKYISPSAILSLLFEPSRVNIRLRDGGRFIAYSQMVPSRITIDGEPVSNYNYSVVTGRIEISVPGSGETCIEIRF